MSVTPQYHKQRILKLPELYTLKIAKLIQQYSRHALSQPFLRSSPILPQFMIDLPEQRLKTNFTFQNFLQHVLKILLNMKELKYGT